MFAGSLRESFQHERIELKEVDGAVVSALIDYCYTSRININQDNVMLLLTTADLLQFDTVRQLCSDFLIGQLSPHNCIEMAKLAHSLGMWDLKSASELFLLHNVGDVAQIKGEFFGMNLEQFETMLLDGNLRVPKEETIVELIMAWVLHEKKVRLEHIPRLIKHVRLPFVRRFYLLQISHFDSIIELCKPLIHEAKQFHEMKLDIGDYADQTRFKPRLSTGFHEIFVRIGGTNAELDELSVVEGYNPVTRGWRRLSEPLGEPLRGGYSTCALGQDLYICGGRLADGLISNKVFRFKPQVGDFEI